MSEEKPTFKITDRRLFNPDGTPRDIPREEEPPPEAPPPAAPPAATLAPEGVGAASRGVAGAGQPGPAERERDATPRETAAGGAEDCRMLVEFIGSMVA